MAGAMSCPSCGESEELRGQPRDGDIRVTCLRCQAQWMRGAPRCAGCGGEDIVERPQAMTRHSRGTQLSIIGWRQIPLCRACDADALTASIDQNTAVPGDYVSVCLYGDERRPAVPARPPGALPPPVRPEPQPEPEPGPEPEAKPAAESKPAAAAPSHPTPRPRTAPTPSRRSRPAGAGVPTVRQAVAAFLAEASGEADPTAMLLLGTHLGSYNRLSVLDEPDAGSTLAAWCAERWPDPGTDAAQRALGTIRRAVDFWGARGWLASDPAEALR